MECYDFSRLDPDTLVTCPFDEVHRVSVQRLVRHLIKCSKNNNTSNYKFCPYTYLHVVPASELDSHVARCEYRKLVENQIQSKDPAPRGGYTELPVSNHSSSWKPSTSEDWDEEVDSTTASEGFEFTEHCQPAYNQRLPEQNDIPRQHRPAYHHPPPANPQPPPAYYIPPPVYHQPPSAHHQPRPSATKEPQYRDYRYYSQAEPSHPVGAQQQSSHSPASQQRQVSCGRGKGVLGLPRQPRSGDQY